MRDKPLQNSIILCLFPLLCITMLIPGCKKEGDKLKAIESSDSVQSTQEAEDINLILPSSEITMLEDGFYAVRFDGDYGFDGFLEQGGAKSDSEVVRYLADNLLSGLSIGNLLDGVFGCSTVAVQSPEEDALFGRNFDWENCEAMVVAAYPEDGYASISTVNMDFITRNVGVTVGLALNLDEVKTLAALYAPLDGMNEAGLAVSVNMIQDSEAINQDTGKPGLTTTTAIRLLLDRAGSVDEALKLLEQYDLHSSMGMMVHLALADSTGRSVVVEYIDNEMIVTETPVVTNFYLAEGDRQGVGTKQSHERYEILMNRLEETPRMDMTDLRDALDSVSKDNFGELESTEWSIVMNLSLGEARY